MSKKNSREGISVFQKYLTVWVFLCMVVGILIGKFLPVIPDRLGGLNIAGHIQLFRWQPMT